jgi:hypothetical protein
MADYGTVALLQEYLPQVVDTALLGNIVTRASRYVDRLCQVPDDFFAVAGASSAKVFLGTGLQMLTLTPFVSGSLASTGAVTVEDDTSTIEYRLRDNRYLLRQTSDALWLWGEPEDYDWQRGSGRRAKPVWPADKRVTVTAQWGWSATPVDVVHATLELAGVMYRQNPERQLSLDTGDAQIEEAAIPVRVRLLKATYSSWEGNDAE